jgi:hypothetical protein
MYTTDTSIVFRLYTIAEQYKCIKLRTEIIRYFRVKHKEVCESEEFKELLRLHPNIIVEMCYLPIPIKRRTDVLLSLILAVLVIRLMFLLLNLFK